MKRERKAAHIDPKAKGKGRDKNINKRHKGSKKRAVVKEVSIRTKIIWIFVLTAVTLIAYYPAFDNEITSWDDEFYINENPYL